MTEQRSRIEAVGENWPIYARLLGAGIGVAEMIAGFVGLPVSTPVLGFAGALLVAPHIAGAQQKRNRIRAAAAKLAEDSDPER